jgi:hypothetical protein
MPVAGSVEARVVSMQDLFLIIHFIGLAMGVGTSFAMLRIGIAAKELAPPERVQLFRQVMSISKNGSVGLGLLIVSGLCMLFTRGVATVFGSGGMAFHIKLTLVLVLAGLLGVSQVRIKRFREKQDAESLANVAKLGPPMMLTGLGIVVAAVLAFH